ncbi:MAG: hypothetical protein OWU33_15215 [Firmicutes bacterium]|nr:hypothetical protein [Bacillota bacterium]
MAHVSSFLTIERLKQLGFDLHLDADGLFTVTPVDRLTPDLVRLVKLYRTDLAAELLMHDPKPIPWDIAVAEALARRTAEAFGRLEWSPAIIPWAQENAGAFWMRFLDAQEAVDTAFRAHDMQAVAVACRDWWQALRLLVARHAAAEPTRFLAKEELTRV